MLALCKRVLSRLWVHFPPPDNHRGVPDSWLVWTDYVLKWFCKNIEQFAICLLPEDLIKNTIIKLYLHNSKYATMLLKAHALCWESLNFDFTLKDSVITPPNKQDTKSKQEWWVSEFQSTDAVKSCVLWHVCLYRSACVIKSPLTLACHWSLFIASGSYPWHTFGLQNGILTSWCPGSAKHSVLHAVSIKWHSAPLCYIQIWWELHWQKWHEVWWADQALDNHIGLEYGNRVCVCVYMGYTLYLRVMDCRRIYCFENFPDADAGKPWVFVWHVCPVLFTWECLCRVRD